MKHFGRLSLVLVTAILAGALWPGFTSIAAAQEAPKIVVQISSSDGKASGRTLKRVGWLMDSYANKATIEVVAIGPAFGLVAKGGKFAGAVKKLMGRGVTFTADRTIQMMLKKMGKATDLIGGVEQVHDGPAHIVKLQIGGYRYLALFF